jgi:hypothetical protein
MSLFNVSKMLTDNANGDCTPRSYSGRFMYGKDCFALDGSFGWIMRTIESAVVEAGNLYADHNADLQVEERYDEANNLRHDFDKFVRTIFRFKIDSMGLGSVVYWPSIQADPETDEDDE